MPTEMPTPKPPTSAAGPESGVGGPTEPRKVIFLTEKGQAGAEARLRLSQIEAAERDGPEALKALSEDAQGWPWFMKKP